MDPIDLVNMWAEGELMAIFATTLYSTCLAAARLVTIWLVSRGEKR